MIGVSERPFSTPETGLAISFPGVPVPAGVCFGGMVSGWNVGAVLTVCVCAAETVWGVVRTPADFFVTVSVGMLRRAGRCCRAVIRKSLLRWIKPKAAILASCLRMRR